MAYRPLTGAWPPRYPIPRAKTGSFASSRALISRAAAQGRFLPPNRVLTRAPARGTVDVGMGNGLSHLNDGVSAAEGDAAVLLEHVADALLALSNVEMGDFDTRLEVDGVDARLTDLFAGINEMIEAHREEAERLAGYRRQLEERLVTIEHQRSAIRELSTPILEVWEGVLCLPVVGVVDTMRGADMASQLLEAIVARRTRYAVVDITGIDVMDTATADHFVRLAASARLLGAECALTGMGPNIAQTLVHMGVDLAGLVTYRSLEDALASIVVRERDRNAARRQRHARARAR